MENNEIDPNKVRSGLFGLITAKLEDVHMLAVEGQSQNTNGSDTIEYVAGIKSGLEQIDIQLKAIHLIVRQ